MVVLSHSIPWKATRASKPGFVSAICFEGRVCSARFELTEGIILGVALGGKRNQVGLDERQIRNCTTFWELIGGTEICALDVSQAASSGSRTRFVLATNQVLLGSDAYPGIGTDARSRMSMQSCLAHELAHAERHGMGIVRPVEMPDYYLEEAEASIHGSFAVVLEKQQRRILIEDARDQLDAWLREK